ncbi:bactofilin family protein [Kiritimatiella glycovorans]|nr:polymer-forming cytoskeletal protein [Kiritimatiella glycovorans]
MTRPTAYEKPFSRSWSRLTALVLAWACTSIAAEAADFRAEEEFRLGPGDVLREETWMSAQRMELRGTAQEDIFLAAAEDITLPGSFDSDVWAAAVTVEAGGVFRDDLRAAARNLISVRGTIGGNALFTGQTIAFEPETEIGGDLFCAGTHVIVKGGTFASARVMAREITLDGDFDGDVRLSGTEIRVRPGTHIRGDLVYSSPRRLRLDERVRIDGELRRAEMRAAADRPWHATLFNRLFFCLAALIVAFPFMRLFPGYAHTSAALFRQHPWRCGLTGTAAMLLLPVVIFFLLISLIGTPLGVVLLGFSAGLAYLGRVVVALVIGSLLLRTNRRAGGGDFATAALGLLALYLLTALPAFAGPLWIAVTAFGFGALLLGLSRRHPPPPPPAHMDDESGQGSR